MGFVKEGNRLSAEIGGEIRLIEWFINRGYVIEIHDEVLEASYQVRGDSPHLDHYDDEQTSRITQRKNLKLEHLDFEEEVRKKGLNSDDVPLTRAYD